MARLDEFPLARGHSARQFRTKLGGYSATLICVIAGLSLYGLPGLLYGLVLSSLIHLVLYNRVIAHEFDREVWWLYRLQMPPVVLTGVAIVLAWLLGSLLQGYLKYDWLCLLVKGSIFLGVYAASTLAFRPRGWVLTKRLLKEYHYKLGPLGKWVNRYL